MGLVDRRALGRGMAWRGALFALLALAPFSAARACIWTIADEGMPFPPCPMNDAQVQARLRQGTVRQLVQDGELAMEVYNMKLETQGRQGTNQVINQFVDQMENVYGDMDVSPVPSLVSTYESSPVLTSLMGTSGEEQVFLVTGTDTTMLASYKEAMDSMGVRLLMNYSDNAAGRSMRDWMVSLRQMETHTEVGGDSLIEQGQRYGERYSADGTTVGKAEAQNSQLFSGLSDAQASVLEAQARAAQAKTDAAAGAHDANQSKSVERRIGGHP